MNLKRLFNNLITANSDYKDLQSFRRMVIVNSILYASVFIFFSFTIINFLSYEYFISVIDVISGIISVYALYKLRKNKILKDASNIATANLFIFFISFTFINQSNDFGLVWTLFFPLFAILVHGHKRGIIISGLFYIVLFPIAFNGIGSWQESPWNLHSFIRLVFSSILLSYVIYFYELAQEKSEKQLESIRKNEEEILRKLRLFSNTDSLTKLYNRRYFNEIIPKLLSLSQRNKNCFTFFILDVDFFKEYNDFYGHQAGDTALRSIADTLKKTVQRNDDFVFRLGGEEFGGVVITNDMAPIDFLMQKILDNIISLKIPHERSNVSKYLTASIGYVALEVNENTTIETIYKQADNALYQAKKEGRNLAVKAD